MLCPCPYPSTLLPVPTCVVILLREKNGNWEIGWCTHHNFHKELSILTFSPGVVLLQFWARVRVSAWLFYSNCLDVRLYFCQFLFWCSFMWFLFAAFWRALFVDVHWLALNCLELQPCLPQLGSPFFSLLTKKIWPCPCLPLEIPKQNVYTRKKRCMDISSTITGWDKVLIRELFNIPCGLTWILDL